MGLLDGDLTPVVGAAFGWLLLPGLLYRRRLVDNGKGGFVGDGFPDPPEAVKVMVDDVNVAALVSEVAALGADFKEADVRLLVLAFNSETGQAVDPLELDDQITVQTGIHAGRYHILPPTGRDAAGTHWTARGRPV